MILILGKPFHVRREFSKEIDAEILCVNLTVYLNASFFWHRLNTQLLIDCQLRGITVLRVWVLMKIIRIVWEEIGKRIIIT